MIELAALNLVRVELGLDFLLDRAPERVPLMDLDNLDVRSGDMCPCGQIFALDAAEHGYHNGYWFIRSRYSLCWMISRGFIVDSFDTVNYTPEDLAQSLEDAWRVCLGLGVY